MSEGVDAGVQSDRVDGNQADDQIDKESVVPYYHQLKTILGDRIRRGVLRPDDPLPSENTLCREYGVSRATVRKAIADLHNENLIYTVRGKGTFVSKPKLEQSLFRFYSFGRDLKNRGFSLISRTLKQESVRLSREVAARLRRTERDEAAIIERVRLLDDVPLAIETSYVVGDGVEALLTADLQEASIYDIVEDATGLSVLKAEEFLEPVVIDTFEAELLHCEKGLPAFHIERLAYLEESRPFELRTSLVRGDRFRFFAELR